MRQKYKDPFIKGYPMINSRQPTKQLTRHVDPMLGFTGEKIHHFYPLASRASRTKNPLALMIF